MTRGKERSLGLIYLNEFYLFMNYSTKMLRESLQPNWVIIPLTILSLAGASMLLLQRPERESSNNFKVPLTSFILARVAEADTKQDTKQDTEEEPLNNGTPDSSDSTASAQSGGTPGSNGDSAPSKEGTPPAKQGTGARPQE